MKELKELLKKRFELFVKMQWLKTINQEVEKRNKYYENYQREVYVVAKLIEEYEIKFGELIVKAKPKESEGEG